MDARGSASGLDEAPESLLIGGAWRAARDGRTTEVTGPFGALRPALFAQAGPRDAGDAVAAARLAFDQGPWPRMPGRERAQILYDAADLIEEHSARLALLQAVETGAPVRFGERDDVPFAAMALRFFAAMASQQARGQSSTPSVGGIALREPRGVVAAFCAFHHPLAMAAAILGPALAMGDTVVLKPPVSAPSSLLAFARLCQEAGVPPGALNVVTGARAAGCALASSSGVDLVSFLGSVPQGRQLAMACASQFVPMDLDLGLPNAHLVFEDACVESAAWQTARSLLPGRAEFRASGVRVLVHEKVYPEFLECLRGHAEALVSGDPRDPATRLGPLACPAERAALDAFVEGGRATGTRLVEVAHEPADGGSAAIVPELRVPLQVLEVPRVAASRAVGAVPDVFAPLALVTPFATLDEALAVANHGTGTRSCGLHTADVARAGAVAEALRTEVCRISACSPGEKVADLLEDEDADESVPLREFDLDSARPFTRQKAVWIDMPY